MLSNSVFLVLLSIQYFTASERDIASKRFENSGSLARNVAAISELDITS
jgi:hypothetical protein